MSAPTVDQDTLAAARAYLWHACHRNACHTAHRDLCECQCGGDFHKAGGSFALSAIPPDLLAQLRAEAQPDRKANPRTPGPRRHRRNSAQLSMLLVQ